MSFDTSAINARVAAGIRFLDGHEPGWRNLIDPERLDMRKTDVCIFGQLEGSIYFGFQKYGLHSDEDNRSPHRCVASDRDDPAFQLGILTLLVTKDDPSDQDVIDADMTLLTDAWKRALTKETA